jgi:hypothetical protein
MQWARGTAQETLSRLPCALAPPLTLDNLKSGSAAAETSRQEVEDPPHARPAVSDSNEVADTSLSAPMQPSTEESQRHNRPSWQLAELVQADAVAMQDGLSVSEADRSLAALAAQASNAATSSCAAMQLPASADLLTVRTRADALSAQSTASEPLEKVGSSTPAPEASLRLIEAGAADAHEESEAGSAGCTASGSDDSLPEPLAQHGSCHTSECASSQSSAVSKGEDLSSLRLAVKGAVCEAASSSDDWCSSMGAEAWSYALEDGTSEASSTPAMLLHATQMQPTGHPGTVVTHSTQEPEAASLRRTQPATAEAGSHSEALLSELADLIISVFEEDPAVAAALSRGHVVPCSAANRQPAQHVPAHQADTDPHVQCQSLADRPRSRQECSASSSRVLSAGQQHLHLEAQSSAAELAAALQDIVNSSLPAAVPSVEALRAHLSAHTPQSASAGAHVRAMDLAGHHFIGVKDVSAFPVTASPVTSSCAGDRQSLLWQAQPAGASVVWGVPCAPACVPADPRHAQAVDTDGQSAQQACGSNPVTSSSPGKHGSSSQRAQHCGPPCYLQPATDAALPGKIPSAGRTAQPTLRQPHNQHSVKPETHQTASPADIQLPEALAWRLGIRGSCEEYNGRRFVVQPSRSSQQAIGCRAHTMSSMQESSCSQNGSYQRSVKLQQLKAAMQRRRSTTENCSTHPVRSQLELETDHE